MATVVNCIHAKGASVEGDRMNSGRGLLHVIVAVAMIAAIGCQKPPGVNPFVDDALPPATWSTPSADAVLATDVEPAHRQRKFVQSEAPSVAGEVPHYPLWWEDPFEDKGDGDATFAWTWADYVAFPYAPARFLLNTVAWPVSAVVTPPFAPMVSDGIVRNDHDAERGRSPNPTTELSDFHPDLAAETEADVEAAEAAHSAQEG
jgi:hypothetical protein